MELSLLNHAYLWISGCLAFRSWDTEGKKILWTHHWWDLMVFWILKLFLNLPAAIYFSQFSNCVSCFCSGFIVAVRGRERVKHTYSISHGAGARHIYTYVPYECITYSEFSQIILKIKNTLCTTYVGCYTNRLCEHCKRGHLPLVGQKVLAYTQPYCPEIASSFLHEMKWF